jgi:hypothetical protein
LPDGLFSNQKSQIWVNFGGPLNGKCWYILWPFGIFYGHLVFFVVLCHIFPTLECLDQEKSGNPACQRKNIPINFTSTYISSQRHSSSTYIKYIVLFLKNYVLDIYFLQFFVNPKLEFLLQGKLWKY